MSEQVWETWVAEHPTLIGEVLGHDVHCGSGLASLRHKSRIAGQTVVRLFLPCSVDALDLGLATEDTLSSDLTGHPGDFAGEDLELVHHGADEARASGSFGPRLLSVHADLLGEGATGRGRDNLPNL